MSAIDTSCYPIPPERESGAGEMNRYKPISCDGSSTAHLIVSEIVNDIFDNAFDVIMAKSIQPVPTVEKISPNVVGDILENILSSSPNIGVSNNDSFRHDETVLLDDEIKRIIKEMKYPPEQKSVICTQGVGDQLGDKPEITPDKILAEAPKRNTLERKNRLTNLVRNSKQMLAKFVTNEDENVLKRAKSEELHEKLIKVIDLECSENTGNSMIPGSSRTTPGILQLTSDSGMDMVDLESNIYRDDQKRIEKDEKDIAKIESKKGVSVSKKKWSFGAKIMKYIRRRPKKE